MKTKQLLYVLFISLFTNILIAQEEVAIYVSDAGNFNNPPWQILKFDENGDNPEVFIDDNIEWPQDIIFLENDGIVLISSLNSGLITTHNSTTGDFIENFASGIGGPTRMKIGDDNLLYVLQWQGNGTVFRYELDGTFVDEFTDVGVPQSIGIDWDSEGNLYVASFTGDSVEKFDSDGNFIETFIDSNLLGPTNIWFEDNGDLIVIDYNGGAVKRFDSEGNYLGDFITGINFAEGFDFLPNGDILIGDGNNSAVNQYSSDGTFIGTFIESGAGNLLTPNAIVRRVFEPLSVENVAIENIEITPTLGSVFTVHNTENISQIKNIEIYNLLGQHITSIKEISTTTIWDAKGHSNGVYFMEIVTNNDTKKVQKLIVQQD